MTNPTITREQIAIRYGGAWHPLPPSGGGREKPMSLQSEQPRKPERPNATLIDLERVTAGRADEWRVYAEEGQIIEDYILALENYGNALVAQRAQLLEALEALDAAGCISSTDYVVKTKIATIEAAKLARAAMAKAKGEDDANSN